MNKRRLSRITIRQRIFLAMILVSLFPTLVMGIIVYVSSKNTIEGNYNRARAYQLEVSSKMIDIQLSSIVDLTRTLLTDNTVKDLLLKDEPLLSENQELKGILRNITSQDYLISGISLISKRGQKVFASNRNDYNAYYYSYYAKQAILEEAWIEKAELAQGGEVFFGYNVLFPTSGEGDISFVKKLIAPSGGQTMGYLVVNIQKRLFEKSFASDTEGFRSNRNMILNQENRPEYIYFSSHKEQSEIVAAFLATPDNGSYLFSDYVNSMTGWVLVSIIDKSELGLESAYIGLITAFVCLGLISLSLYASSFVSKRITRPLKKLENVITAVSDGDRRIDDVFDDSEIGRIGSLFVTTVTNNVDLRERLLTAQLNQKEAELLLLQAQIQPHFLYNTLDALYCLAIIKQADDIAAMAAALSNMFKLSLNQGEKTIAIKKEVERISEYMVIQNMRFRDRFHLFLDIAPELLEKKIITFILQPFVENAFYHGLEPKIGSGYIRIRGRLRGETMVFFVVDNGIGMTEQELASPGFGIRNVRERIGLYYGANFGVTFKSRPGQGTIVCIRLAAKISGEAEARL